MKTRLLLLTLILSLIISAFTISISAEDKKVADCDFDLNTHTSTGDRLVRISETNLGNLISDAFRNVLGADIAYFNGGGICSHIEAGEITFNDLLNVLPSNNTGVVVEVSGETIVEMLELAVSKWPEESANFPHVSGMTFLVNTLAEENNKVYSVEVLNSETGVYEALEPDKMYTVASNNFILLECGDGMTMFEGANVVSDTGILDVEILEKYITENLGGVIGAEYVTFNRHLAFTEGEIDSIYEEDGSHAIWIAAIGLILAITTILVVRRIRKKRDASAYKPGTTKLS